MTTAGSRDTPSDGDLRPAGAAGLTRSPSDEFWMGEALVAARAAGAAGDVPVGALIVREGTIVARAGNRTVRDLDATSHAEMVAIRAASASLGRWRLDDCVLYVTLEPCAMCAGALVLARIRSVVFGAWDDKAGMAGSAGDILRHPRLNHTPAVRGGIREEECGTLLRDFFRSRRGAVVDTPTGGG